MVNSMGRMPLGHKAIRRRRKIREARTKETRQAELARDRARFNLFEMRRRYKLKVRGNEGEMNARKRERQKSLNPTADLETITKRKWAKLIRNPVNWSSVPLKPKCSRVAPRERIYGKRFEIWDKKIGRKGAALSKEYEEAKKKMAESVTGLRKDIEKRAKELEAKIGGAESTRIG